MHVALGAILFLAVMAVMILWMGIGSTGFTRRIEPSVTYLLETM